MRTDLQELCREATQGLPGAVECCLLDATSGQPLARHLADRDGSEASARFAALALTLLGPTGEQHLGALGLDPPAPSSASPECHAIDRDLMGFARRLRRLDAVLVLTASAASKVGQGWAVLGTTAARLESP